MNASLQANGPSILVIDDEMGLRDMLVYGLTKRGYRVTLASHGEEGLEKARRQAFDLAVCDIMMPGLSGIAVLKELKLLRPNIQVIIATGNATVHTAIEAMKEGAYDYLTKPFGLGQLCTVLEKALEHQRLLAKVGHLEELHRLKNEFIANMSHELRTPMQAITGFLSLMLAGTYGSIPESQTQVLKRVQTNAKNLVGLIGNLLDLSKLTSGREPLFLESCNLSELVKGVLEIMRPLATTKKLELTSDVPADIWLKTDVTKLKQMLINLVGNAIKFTAQGRVALRAALVPGQALVELSVQDTGIGIQEKDVPILFQEFRQLDATTTREYGGTGLGLFLCKKIADLLGGSIRVQTRWGSGSTFTVTLPVQTDHAVPSADLTDALVSSGADQRIVLAIDDEPDVLQLIHDTIQNTGYVFMGAQSGDEGLALARKYHPHLITLDIMMPHRDGWSVLQALKSDPELRSIPVFIVSIVENRALAFSLGVTDYIVKPFERDTLLEKLHLIRKSSRAKILLVDDDPQLTEWMRADLTKEGYAVETATQGAPALEKIARYNPDYIFLDLALSDPRGFNVLEVLNKDPRPNPPQVFVLTDRAPSANEAAYLEKRVVIMGQKKGQEAKEILSLFKQKLAAGLSHPSQNG